MLNYCHDLLLKSDCLLKTWSRHSTSQTQKWYSIKNSLKKSKYRHVACAIIMAELGLESMSGLVAHVSVN